MHERYGMHFYDGDSDLTDEMKAAIAARTVITDAMRDVFFDSLIQSIHRLQGLHDDIVVAQTFIKDKYRQLLLTSIPEARFIMIQADEQTRVRRLVARTDYPLDVSYARNMTDLFDPPQRVFAVLDNSADGDNHLIKQLDEIVPRGG